MAINDLLNKLKNIVEYDLNNLNLFIQALSHKSSRQQQNYERLEFLGDALLELITTEYLYFKYPNLGEGILTSIRSALVKTDSLAYECKRLGLNYLIIMSHSEERSGGREKQHVLANVFESVIGAIYLDTKDNKNFGDSLTATRNFIYKNLLYKTDEIYQKRLDLNPKTKLQEISQEIFKITPSYKLVNETGPDHNKTFVSQVLINDVVLGEGSGKSKQESEKNAAKNAIQNWDKLNTYKKK